MNTRYFPSEDMYGSTDIPTFSFSSNFGDNRLAAGNQNGSTHLRHSSLLVRTTMRISRARWFSFLRRVYHYQNSSRSHLGSNPFNYGSWIALEFLVLVFQINIISFILSISKEEKPVWPVKIWILGYDLGCLLSLPLLYWRYWHAFRLPNVQQERVNEESRSSRYMNKSRTVLELFFAIWFVMGNVWVFDTRFGSFDQAPKLHVLCISLLAWNAISYSFPFLLFLLFCCFVPLISKLLGYNMNMGSFDRGATDDQISRLPSWRYKEVEDNLELGNDADSSSDVENETSVCL
ncbi:E3 ubiquitin-protein ligase [Thalictrum thalictroides]|uniref:E3 ubiquitin-protein ligase n=1 Tax=Thalictrum thalictroides TaxID=46969 RepID=A0A7J6UWW5_THATH|nr:E3 ubiquitin-protein ligase [Thalictrum thalictroides]